MAFKSCNHPIPIYISSFSIKTLMHTNTSSKTTIYLSWKHHTIQTMLCMLMIVFLFIVSLTLSSLLWALRSLRYYEPYALFDYYEPYALFVIMSLTLSSLLWALRSLRYYEPYALFIIMSLTLSSLLWALRSLRYYVFMLYALQFKLYTPILCKSCFLQIPWTNQHEISSFFFA
jgi:nitrogen fixation-related uncharacterized protein